MTEPGGSADQPTRGPRTPDCIEVRGGHVHNLKGVDVNVPLGEIVGIAGVSGSGKSSLALGVLYAEGSRRYLEALSTYTRRRLSQATRADVDEIRHVPAALALRQRPAVPGVRSTFGTMSELLNSLRLLFSRAGSHVCPRCGARCAPTLAVAAEQPIVCPSCGASFAGPGAEDLAFNSGGACPTCGGTGVARSVNRAALVPDESKTIDQGAVAPWGSLMWDLMKQVAAAMGVRTDVPFRDLTPEERRIVFDGPPEKKHILYRPKKGDGLAELDFTYYSAVRTVENALSKVKDEKGMKRVERFLTTGPCPDCGGTRLSAAARAPHVRGIDLASVCEMPLSELCAWVAEVPESLPAEMRPMATSICESFDRTARRLLDLGLSYLSLDRAGSTLSTGERQRVQLARAVRNRTTGVLYVLDEPSIGLHPANIDGLVGVMRDLVADGNSVVMVDHDVRILREAAHIIEMGPVAGEGGGQVIAQGTVAEVCSSPASRIAPFLSGKARVEVRDRAAEQELFSLGRIHLETRRLHTVQPLSVDVPRGRLTCVTGVSGSGKTTLVLETLVPALQAAAAGNPLPDHVAALDADGIGRANLIDASPIGINVRSTVATYTGVLDELRRAFARTPAAKAARLKAGDFSYNTGSLRCPTCDGTGEISLDVQFLPDVSIPCPDCHGSRYGEQAGRIAWSSDAEGAGRTKGTGAPANAPDASRRATATATRSETPSSALDDSRVEAQGGVTLPDLMAMSVDAALDATAGLARVERKLATLHDLGLGYLTLGEATPALSGGEAQRLKLASEMGRSQKGSVFVFDEPTIGLHPLDVKTLLGVFERLVSHGATVVVIEHDLDVINNADYLIDMGPGGGAAGGRAVACGTPEQVAACPESVTGRYLR